MNWPAMIWFLAIHCLALCALLEPSWDGAAVAALLAVVSGLGVTVGFHRLLTHKSFQTYDWVRWTLAFVGQQAGEGSAVQWVAIHRRHHAYSDNSGDPHSPLDGLVWSHIGWMMRTSDVKIERYAPDLAADKMLMFLNDSFLYWHFCTGLILYGLGGWQWVCWGMGLRLFVVLHTTWMVNSVCHYWGYRNYNTLDESRNNPMVAALTFGEGWHNNHHAKPTAANHGHRWFELDPSYWCILILKSMRLAWNVKTH